MSKLPERVIDFVCTFTGVARRQVTPASTLFGDLGIDGADGWELIKAFGEQFQVDLSEFRADKHFGPEGLPIYAPLVWAWCLLAFPFRSNKTPEERAGLIAIRLADLVTAAESRQWNL